MPNDKAYLDLITEDWLKKNGFKWHQLDRQPDKHWLLWLGWAVPGNTTCVDDIGIEVAPMFKSPEWFCWLRSDSAGRYHRFIHLRHIASVKDITKLCEAITGQKWDPANNIYGTMRTPAHAAQIRQENERLDREINRERAKWSEIEKDDTRGRALPEHMEAHEKAKEAAGDDGGQAR